MRRLPCHLFTHGSAVSLLLCVAVRRRPRHRATAFLIL
jgi:hypothetical protein